MSNKNYYRILMSMGDYSLVPFGFEVKNLCQMM